MTRGTATASATRMPAASVSHADATASGIVTASPAEDAESRVELPRSGSSCRPPSVITATTVTEAIIATAMAA